MIAPLLAKLFIKLITLLQQKYVDLNRFLIDVCSVESNWIYHEIYH